MVSRGGASMRVALVVCFCIVRAQHKGPPGAPHGAPARWAHAPGSEPPPDGRSYAPPPAPRDPRYGAPPPPGHPHGYPPRPPHPPHHAPHARGPPRGPPERAPPPHHAPPRAEPRPLGGEAVAPAGGAPPYPGAPERPPPGGDPAPDGPPEAASDEYLEPEKCAALFEHFDKDYFFAELKRMYKRRMLPLELGSRFGHFASPPMGPADFDAKPMVLVLGQYSVGKTSFIRSLLGRDFPGIRIGPEPTTDRFLAIMGSDDGDRVVPGNALAMRYDKPFGGLQGFGNAFLEKLQGAEVVGAPILDNVTIVDTPGVLSGEKQRLGRDYDFPAVVRWFAERADMIVVMFDAHKLDISDELKATVEALRGHAAKMRVVLNKADMVSPQQLLRVYGALMWQLGRVIKTPEVARVHLGSFWDGGAPRDWGRDHAALLARERDDLLAELRDLPKNAVLRRINELSKRARRLKVHAYLVHFLRKQMPAFFGKDDKQQKLLADLPRQFALCRNRYGLTAGDFPDVLDFRDALLEVTDLSKIPKLDKHLVNDMDKMFATDIPKLLDRAVRAPPGG